MVNNMQSPSGVPATKTTFLIIGAGPAGASLACFLASYGLKGILVAAASGTSKEPRAHITNMATLECLRDIGLEREARINSAPVGAMQHTRWGHDMAGEEFARTYSWDHQPHHIDGADIGETRYYPWMERSYESSLVQYERSPSDGHEVIISTIEDNLTGLQFKIESKYLFGCDGTRSQVMKQLDIPLIKKPTQGLAFNVRVEADLSKHIRARTGNLHWCFTPEIEHPLWGWRCLVRMVKPWHEWMFIIFPAHGYKDEGTPTEEEFLKRVKEFIGNDEVPAKILGSSKWYINDVVAERYSDGNILCLGDAVHRHPPVNGLGSNTSIQDAWNLAWKVAYVEKGIAGPRLLDTYNSERQPVGTGITKRANQGLADNDVIWEALGLTATDVKERVRQHAELKAATPEGRARRRRFYEAVAYTEHEFGAIGTEMNQLYESSAVYAADEQRLPAPLQDEVLEQRMSTYPGSRLPHAWLNKRVPGDPISTIDLAGHGAFCVLTGIGGEKWKQAASEIAESLGIEINAYSIGWDQDWEDVYRDWERRRENEEDGCLLLRPDRTVAWRSMTLPDDPRAALFNVLNEILDTAGRSK